ncbi:UvrD-helicase domain-containing protein [Chryseobacterium sp. R2A-55]|uniref:UvrD-helicase domain-containing protein n=1 Tax=Chryseobacterium sp. R2A-55 TaxID=2744445 RepID=UPI001F381422|nr:UvrD-helicase domain-containing protein [Chryseobacterium sp. R2A-55]
MIKNYTVINASAGSGKTYNLVLNLLAICLKYPAQPDKIRNILALTFTNKAANEMKHRIIEWLKNFIKDDFETNRDLAHIQEKLAKQNVKVSLQELHERSKSLLDYILHHYSTLNIGTIDKFNSRLVRSFTHELGLAQNFNLEINPEPFLMEAVDKMLEEIGTDHKISETFMDFMNYNLDNEERISLNKTLYKSAKEYVQDKHFFELAKNKDFDWEVYEKSKKTLREEIQNLKEDSIKTAKETLDMLRKKNLQADDFSRASGGTLGKFFENVLDHYLRKAKFPFPDDETTAQENYRKGAASKSKNRQPEILEILENLIDHRQKIIGNYIRQKKKEKILGAILPLKVNKDIQDKLAEIEEENDLVLLSKFNVLIHENLREEPSSFIYEKVGTKFSHYFFDEFQDTSSIQWQNFLPLRDHAISQENMSFTLVGDPKQSIYRFRGGDSQLMLDIINKNEKTQTFAELEHLKYNYRSAKNIVDFNNHLYRFMAGFTMPEHEQIFGEGSFQNAQSKFEGRVRVNLVENANKQTYYTEVSEKMQQDIQHCLDNGFRFSDIAILCRGNFDIFSFSKLLGNLKVLYNGEETHVKTISESGLTLNLSSTLLALTEFLRWEDNPKNHQFLVKMLYHLKVLGRITTGDFSAEMLELLKLGSKSEMEHFMREKYALNLNTQNLLQLNLYNFIEHFLSEFMVKDKETDFLLNYLEMVFVYSQNAGSTLKNFLQYWDEEANETTIQASDNVDAIQIMTIHKAKGLEFPVVFLPMENENKDGNFTSWLPVDSEIGLNSVNINGFEKALENYDQEMASFNQKNSYQNRIDRFCLQYVATTRAVEQLFLYIEKPNKTKNNLEIFEFLEQKIPRNESGEEVSSFDLYEVSEEILQKQSTEKKSKPETESIDYQPHRNSNPESIKIATPSKSYQNRVEKVRIGIFTHEILSKINSGKDVERVLKSYLLEGSITTEEKDEISERIFSIIHDQKYSKYFLENQTIINEKDIMISEHGESKTVRPDRMIETENGYIILDFKTGAEKEKHQTQIDGYKSVLEKLGKTVLETEIIYI